MRRWKVLLKGKMEPHRRIKGVTVAQRLRPVIS